MRTRTRARALLALAGIVPLALLCVASAADRMGTPIGLLPDRLAPRGALLGAHAAAAGGPRPEARALAAAAVAANPMDANALALLGAVALRTGDRAAAQEAFATAAQLGWRNPATQLYWLGMAIELADVTAAAQRLDALLRTDHAGPGTQAALLILQASPAGRAALAERLLLRPEWRHAYAAGAAGLADESFAERLAVLRQARAAGMTLDCQRLTGPVNALFARGAWTRSEDLWLATCGASETDSRGLRDGGFERTGAEVPFEWQLRASGDMDVSVAPAPAPLHGRALRVAVAADTPRTVAAQAIRLAPGRYRITAQAIDDAGARSGAVGVALACPPLAPGAEPRAYQNLPATVAVPDAAACALHQLHLRVDPQRLGGSRVLWIDTVSIQPAAASTGGGSFQGGRP